MENLVTHSRPRRDETGRLVVAMALPADLPRGYVSVRDIGRAAAAVMADEPRLAGRAYDLVAEDLSAKGQDVPFMQAKITTARFYADHILSRAPGVRDAIVEGAEAVTALPAEAF